MSCLIKLLTDNTLKTVLIAYAQVLLVKSEDRARVLFNYDFLRVLDFMFLLYEAWGRAVFRGEIAFWRVFGCGIVVARLFSEVCLLISSFPRAVKLNILSRPRIVAKLNMHTLWRLPMYNSLDNSLKLSTLSCFIVSLPRSWTVLAVACQN